MDIVKGQKNIFLIDFLPLFFIMVRSIDIEVGYRGIDLTGDKLF